MGFNISKFESIGDFELQTEALGKIYCWSMTDAELRSAADIARDLTKSDDDFIRSLIKIVAHRNSRSQSSKSPGGEHSFFSREDIAILGEEDISSFSQQFSQKFQSVTPSNGDDLVKREAESDVQFVRKIVDFEAGRSRRLIEKFLQSTNLLSDSTISAVNRNFDFSKSLADTAAALRKVDSRLMDEHDPLNNEFLNSARAIAIIRNPIEDTNKILKEVTVNMRSMVPLAAQTVELVASMNDSIVRMQTDYIRNAEHIEKQSRNATRLAAAGLLVSAIGLVLSTYFSWRTLQDARSSTAASEIASSNVAGSIPDATASTALRPVAGASATGSPLPSKSKP